MPAIALTVAAIIFVFGIVVLVHELGHFISAKVTGVEVLEFGVGYPPRLLSFEFRGTRYSLNLLPLGGFVKLVGEEDPSHQGSLAGKSIPVRSGVLAAGALMNAVLPVLLFGISFMVPQTITEGFVQINTVAPNSPAAKAGLQPKDIILEVNGRSILNTRELSYNIHLNLGSPTTLLVKRGSQTTSVVAVPRWNPPPGEGATGIVVGLVGAQRVTRQDPPWTAMYKGGVKTVETLILAKNEITRLFIRGVSPPLAGPIGIAQMTGEIVTAGAQVGSLVPIIEFTALLSINLAIMNLLPIPMLDGGRLLFIGLEIIRKGKRISPKRESFVHLVGFAVLIAFVVVVSYFDILRIIRGESLLR